MKAQGEISKRACGGGVGGGGAVWHQRSASVASLWCLAVRLDVAMGQVSWGSGLRRSSVFASFAPSLFWRNSAVRVHCACLFWRRLPVPRRHVMTDELRLLHEREAWEQTHAGRHTCTRIQERQCVQKYMHRQIQTHWNAHTHTHTHTDKHTVAWSKPSLWGIQIWAAVSELDLSCLCADMIVNVCAAYTSLKNIFGLVPPLRPPRLTVTPSCGKRSGHSSIKATAGVGVRWGGGFDHPVWGRHISLSPLSPW